MTKVRELAVLKDRDICVFFFLIGRGRADTSTDLTNKSIKSGTLLKYRGRRRLKGAKGK